MTREGWRDEIKALTGRMEGRGGGGGRGSWIGREERKKLKKVVGGALQ